MEGRKEPKLTSEQHPSWSSGLRPKPKLNLNLNPKNQRYKNQTLVLGWSLGSPEASAIAERLRGCPCHREDE